MPESEVNTLAAPFLNKNVLITGGAGFIGSNLATFFSPFNVSVKILDSFCPNSGANRANLTHLGPNIEVLRSDIRDLEDLKVHLKGVDYIFHCAALTSHPKSMTHPLDNLDTNCRGTLHLLEAQRSVAPNAKLIYLGTSTQVGEMKYQPVDENHSEFPMDIYSAHKLLAEKYCLIYGRAHGLRTTVVRLANNFGPRACINSPDFGVVNYFIGLALQNKPIKVFGSGGQLRSLLFVEDSIRAILLAASNEKSLGEVYFVVNDDQTSIVSMAHEITKHIGGRVEFCDWPLDRKGIEIGDAVISNQKLKDHLDWCSKTSLADGLKKTKEYYINSIDQYL